MPGIGNIFSVPISTGAVQKVVDRVSAALSPLHAAIGAAVNHVDEAGVEPTNNRAERALRFVVLWRKRSNGTQSEKGNRWVERLLSFRQTCRLRAQATFPLLADILKAYFKEQTPNLGWLA